MAKKHLILLSALALLLIGACSRNEEIEQPTSPSGGVEVAILCDDTKEPQVYSLPDGTRTWIDDNDRASTRWDKNDKIALWATADGSNYTLNAQNFSLAYFTPSYSSAVFTSTVADMPAGTYTYTAVSPVPESVSGTQVSYRIPAEQTGRYEGKWDILAADPLTADALPLFEQSDQMLETPPSHALRFRHKCHALRIEVPAGRNIWGEPITRLVIDFPTEVVGTVSFDVADPSAPMMLSNGSKSITLDLNTPLTDEAENYAWAFINPTTVSGDISFTAYTTNGYRSHTLSVPIDREMAAGHITPITLTIPTELPVSYVDFSVTGDSSNLGEEPYNLIVKAPEGMTFRDGTTEQTFPIDESNKYTVAFYGDIYGSSIQERPFEIYFETESAIVPQKVLVTSFTAEDHTTIPVTIPYLFYEDFSEIGEYHTSNEDGGTGEKAGNILTDWGLADWNAARGGTIANTCIKVNSYVLSHSGITDDRVRGRLDTGRLPIKAGKTVSVKVSFDIGYTSKNGILGSGAGRSWPIYNFGRTDDGSGNPIGADTELTWTTLGNRKTDKLSDVNNLPNKITDQTVPGCTASSRLTWQIYTEKESWAAQTTNISYYCHIDNIRVTIVK